MKFIQKIFLFVVGSIIYTPLLLAQDYCTPAYSTGCASGDNIDDVYLYGATMDIVNENTPCGTGGYTDYTDMVADLVIGVEYTGSVSTSYSGAYEYVRIWIDYDEDGEFEDTEVIAHFGPIGGSSPSEEFTVNVPAGTTPGDKRMRVRLGYGSTYASSMDPCASITWGECHDYTVTVIEPEPCEDVDLIAGTLGDMAICPSVPFTLYNVGSSIASGLERVWQSSPEGAGTWTTIAGAEGYNFLSDGITEPTDYRCIVTCTVTGESDTTNVATVSINPVWDCYCIPSSTYIGTNHITFAETTEGSINFSNESETGITGSGYGYSDYTETDTVAQMQTASVNFYVETNPSGSNCNLAIWVDWNQNGLFGDIPEEEVYTYITLSGAKIFSGSFDVPLTAEPGVTRMRIRSVYYYYSWYTAEGEIDPCGDVSYGEAEDYAFVVIPAVSCSDPSIIFPSAANSVSVPENVCGTGDVTLTIDGSMPISTGITYQWQSSATGTGGWTDISGELTDDEFFYEDVSANTYFRCKILCEGEVVMYSDAVLVESVIPEEPVVLEGQTCGPGPVTLTGTVSSGDIFWFETETGGAPFASGDTIETPPITTTTTFYAAGGATPPALVQIGSGTSSSPGSSVGPFSNYYRKFTMQLLYKRDQIEDGGGLIGLIDEMRLNCTGLPNDELPDYTISIKTVPESSMSSLVWQTDGFEEIFGGTGFNYMPTETGWQSFPFTTPIFWDGNSHIIVKICWSQIASGYSSTGTHQYTNTSGQMLYYGNDSEAGTACGATGASSSTYLPNVIFNFPGCASDRVPVIAYVRDTPYVQIDVEDGEYCLFNNLFEIPTSPEQPEGTTYLWNTGETDSFITVIGSGVPTQYWVEVTNEWGCINSDTVHLTLKPSPEVDLGPDTLVCEGGTVPLDAGDDGVDYYWNTGDTTRTIIVDDGGNYSVLVTNEFGCMATDTIHVTVEGYAPTIDGIIVDNLSPTTFQFTPFHPLNVLSYEWTFGDDSDPPYKYDEAPVHTYAEPGTYLVTLKIASSCGEVDYFTYATIVQGIDEYELSKNNLKLYPNPTDNLITVETIGDVKMDQIKVINMLGQEVMTQTLDGQTSVVLDVSRLASGMYQVQIESNKGLLVKKFQVVK